MTTEHESLRPPPYQAVLRAYERRVEDYLSAPTETALVRVWAQQRRLEQEFAKPGRFDLGHTVWTPGAQEALVVAAHLPIEFLLRHKRGDWGDLDQEDRRANEAALVHQSRLLSAYRTRLGAKLWVITESDRSATTLLLPEEY